MPDLTTEIPYEEMHGSPTVTQDLDGVKVVRKLKVAWDQKSRLRIDLLRSSLLGFPENVKCISVTSDPFLARNIGVDHVAAYDFAIITANYETIILTNTESIEPTAEFLTTGVNNLRWDNNAGDQVASEESPGQLLVGLDYMIEKRGIYTLPTNLLELLGKTNDAIVTPVTQGLKAFSFPAETLLFNPPTITTRFDENSAPFFDLTYRLTYKPNWDESVTPRVTRGWNEFWRPSKAGGGGYQKMFEAGGAQYKPFPPGDFSTI